MSDELKPCPFCGGKRTHVTNIRDGLHASCADCFAKGPSMFFGPEDRSATHNAAISAWNTRAEPALQQQGEAVAWVEVTDTHEGPYDFHGKALLSKGKHELYTHPPKPVVSDEMLKRGVSAAKEVERLHPRAPLDALVYAALTDALGVKS